MSNSDLFPGEIEQNFGSNLAEYTGGTYSRAGRSVSEMLAAAGRENCMYRVALRAPENPSAQIRRVRITVRGRVLPSRYHVRFMTPLERWVRRASGYLAHPERAGNLPVRVALIPIARGEGRWDLSVNVGVDPDTLTFVPLGGRDRGDWRVGAMVTRIDDGKSWQMITDSQLFAGDADSHFPAILHARPLRNLKPGNYRLAAIVEDRNTYLLGAMETSMVVAGYRSGETTMGPILLRGQPRVVQLDLPLRNEKRKSPWRVAGVGAGLLPVDPTAVNQGDRLYAATWLCLEPDHAARLERDRQYLRYVARDGVPAFQLPPTPPVPAGECVRIEDVIDTTDLDAGIYSYHLRSPVSARGPEGTDLDLQVAFTVTPMPAESAASAPAD